MTCFSSSNSSVEKAFNLLKMLLTTRHNTLSATEKPREAVFENTPVSQTSEEDRMTGEDQDFYEEDDCEDKWDKHVYENITQKKFGSDIDDEMVSTDYPETVDR